MNRDAAKTVGFTQTGENGILLVTKQNGMQYTIEMSVTQGMLLWAELDNWITSMDTSRSGSL